MIPRWIYEALSELHGHSVDIGIELCGVITWNEAGWGCVMIRNVAEDPSCEYSIDPVEQRKVWVDVYGVFHTHPTTDAVPSEIDAWGMVPGLVYVIVGVDGVRCWEKVGDRVAELTDCFSLMPG